MELRQIQYFIQLYQDLNITKASKNLYISQQGLSKSISRLEEELGFLLFERQPSGVVPTDDANTLYTYFEKISSSYHELLLAIDSIHQNRILKICSFHGFALSCDINLFSEYKKTHADTQIRYEEIPNDAILSHLLDRKADVAFMLAPIPKELVSLQIIRREPLYMVMDRSHPWHPGKPFPFRICMSRRFCFWTIFLSKTPSSCKKPIRQTFPIKYSTL